MRTTDKASMFAYCWRVLAPGAPEPDAEHHFNRPDSQHRFDFAWPAYQVAVEVDGGQWQTHGGRHASDDDRRKLNLAAALGWRVLRFSPAMLEHNPFECVSQVCRALGLDDPEPAEEHVYRQHEEDKAR